MSSETQNLEKYILNTIIYFDLFDFPLTNFEIWKNLFSDKSCTFQDVINTIQTSEILKNKIDTKESFYFLKGREQIINKRKNNYITTYNKYKKGIKFINLISKFHCFKAIFISNSMAIDNANKESDIDLFIVSRPNRLWLSRFISVSIAQLLHLRPTIKTKRNKICLSIFIDQKDLNLNKVCKNKDPMFLYWINQIVPIFDSADVYNEYINSNLWTKNHTPNTFKYKTGYKRVLENSISKKIIRKITKILSLNILEELSKKIEKKIFPPHIKKYIEDNNSEDVFIGESIIKLHDNDNRKIYNNLFLEKINKI